MRIADLLPIPEISREDASRFFALRENDSPQRYSGDRIIPFPQRTDAQRWMLRFVCLALRAGLPTREDESTSWKRLADPVQWVTSNWRRVGGDPRALRKRPSYDGRRKPLKRHWWQLYRRYEVATLKHGKTIWCAPDGRFIFAVRDGGAGSPAMAEAMGREPRPLRSGEDEPSCPRARVAEQGEE